jgi:archaellum component FlaC
MSLWDAANDIEELANKIDNVRNVVELIAEDVENPYSGALWAVYGMLDDLQKKMYIQAADVMEMHRVENQPKKWKK